MRALPLLGLLALLALAAFLAFRALQPAPSDEGRIRALLDDAATAAEERRIGDVVQGVSERFEGSGLDRDGVRRLVAAHVLRGTWVSVAITGERIEVRGDDARALVDVLLSRSGKGTPLAQLMPEQATVHRFALRLERERDGWRVVAAAWRRISLEDAAAGPPSFEGELTPRPGGGSGQRL
jgi:hypothetical protein